MREEERREGGKERGRKVSRVRGGMEGVFLVGSKPDGV